MKRKVNRWVYFLFSLVFFLTGFHSTKILAQTTSDKLPNVEKPLLLFIGSSSIEVWDKISLPLKQSLSQYETVNKGVGGTDYPYLTRNIGKILNEVKKSYVKKPDGIVIYSGDNDLVYLSEEFKSQLEKLNHQQAIEFLASQMEKRVSEFHQKLLIAYQRTYRETLNLPIFYISIKPSPSRVSLIQHVQLSNQKIQHLVNNLSSNISFVNIFDSMTYTQNTVPEGCYASNIPIPPFDSGVGYAICENYFQEDQLHMNQQGYDLWTKIITPILDNTFLYRKNGIRNSQFQVEGARFTVITPNCIRLEYQDDAKSFIDNPTMFAHNRNARSEAYGRIVSTSNNEERFVLQTEVLHLEYKLDGKPFHSENLMIKYLPEKIKWTAGLKNINNLGGTATTLDMADGVIPVGDGVLSKEGWYVFDDSKSHELANDWIQERMTEAQQGMDWYFFGYGKNYKTALKSFTAISGKVPMPRKYVLGSWYSRYWPYSSTDYKNIVKEYQDHDFPLDIMVMDMDWHKDSWTGYSWNRLLLPDAEDLLKWFHDQKLKVTLNDHPFMGVLAHEDMYAGFMNEMGATPNGQVLPFDAGNKKYLETFYNYTHVPRDLDGNDFWWLDWQQEVYTKSIPTLRNLTWLNYYYFKRSTDTGLRGQGFSRFGGWGDHRHPIHFSGDASSNFKMLEFEIPFTTMAGNVGIFYWSHDIGGHWGGKNEESYVRWVQFGALSAALRVHSTRDPKMDRRPWTYSKPAENAMRVAFHLRSQLFPYIYSSVHQAYEQSIPLNRAMYLEYPHEEKAYKMTGQFMFGDHILVAPITTKGEGTEKIAEKEVWFPKGDDWYDYFTGQRFQGGNNAKVQADLNRFPLYFKAGYPIVMMPYSQRMTQTPLDVVLLRTYPYSKRPIHGINESFLYEDDGVTLDYQQGKYSKTKFTYRQISSDYPYRDECQLDIFPMENRFEDAMPTRRYILEFPETQAPSQVTINNEPVEFTYDAELKMTKVFTPKISTSEHWKIRIK